MPEGFEILHDPTPAQWVVDALVHARIDSGVRVRDIVPATFERYARIFHPLLRSLDRGSVPISWSAVARRTGRVFHPEVQFAPLIHGFDGVSTDGVGFLPDEDLLRLRELLFPFTEWQRVYALLWEGYGDQQHLNALTDTRVELNHGHRFLLFAGSLQDIDSFGSSRSPNMWWPRNRAWFVASEIDVGWSYVAGSDELITALLECPGFEVLETAPDHRFDWKGDSINDR